MSADFESGYFHADAAGNPDFSNPMSKAEIVEMYWQTVDDEPSSAADIYIDFHSFSKVQFLIFVERLSSAVLVYRSSMKELQRLLAQFEDLRDSGGHVVPGYAGESEIGMHQNLGVINDGIAISIGAATVSAVAALESLLIDLRTDDEPAPVGLHGLFEDFLSQQKISRSKRRHLIGKELKLGTRRNTFAHTLTGSHFSDDQTALEMLSKESMEDTFHTVGMLAVEIEQLLLDA